MFVDRRCLRRTIALAVALTAVGAAPAMAGTLTIVPVAGGKQIKFTAANGEVNNLQWSSDFETPPNVLIEDDRNMTLGAGTAGCVRDQDYVSGVGYVDDPTTAICPVTGITEYNSVLGDQDDVLRYGSGTPAVTMVRGDLGPGDDGADDFIGGRTSMVGGDGYDTIYTYGGNDTLDGGAGNDTLNTGDGDDSALGGTGDDRVTIGGGPSSKSTARGGDGDDTLAGGDGTDSLLGELGDDTLTGHRGTDTLDGGVDDDTLDGDNTAANTRALADVMIGGTGVDTVTYDWRLYQPVNVNLDGLANDGAAGEYDRVASDVENLVGGSKSDVLSGNGAVNDLQGGSGDDVLSGAGASDTLGGAQGKDQLMGSVGDDYLDGGSDDDVIDGGDGLDTIYGSTGDDDVFGGDAADRIRADDGFDDVDGGPGLDNIDAGPGNDTLRTRDNVQDQVACSGGADIAYLDFSDITDGACASAVRQAGATVDRAGNTLSFFAGPGAANSMSVTLASGVLTFKDTVANISPGSTCTAVDAKTVKCPATGVLAIALDGADLNDSFTQTANISTRFVGGPGDDTLRDSPAPDMIFGGDGVDTITQAATSSGADVVSGGDDVDVVSYAARTTAVAVSLDSLRNDGADADGDTSAEEGDYIRTDVENVTGGSAADWLRGSDVGNLLRGGVGGDRISGGIGRDQLLGDAGPDQLVSRDGNRDSVTCGTEVDSVTADLATVDTVGGDCEAVARG